MRVTAVGLGKLGLPWSLIADAAGHDVIGVDIDAERLEAINRRRVATVEPSVVEMLMDAHCRLRATSRLGTALEGSDVSVVMVPTPSNDDGSFALDDILQVVRIVGEQCESLADPHTVVIVSTVSPGSVDGPIRSTLERAAGRPLDDHLGLAYVPEFHAIGSTVRDIRNPDRLLIGAAQSRSAGIAADLFGSLTDARVPVRSLSPVEVELTKLAFNAYATMQISFANFVDELAQAYGANGRAVCDALGDDRRVPAAFLRPGAPFGGPCFPRDNAAIQRAAAVMGVTAPLPAAVGDVNDARFDEITNAALEASPGAIGVAGLAFKAGTDVLTASPAVELVRRWVAHGRRVFLYDPMVKDSPVAGATMCGSLDQLIDECDVLVLPNDDSEIAGKLSAARGLSGDFVVIDPWGTLARAGLV